MIIVYSLMLTQQLFINLLKESWRDLRWSLQATIMIGLEQPSNIEVVIFKILDLKILDHFILLNYIVLSR